jgi:hypothetical protein
MFNLQRNAVITYRVLAGSSIDEQSTSTSLSKSHIRRIIIKTLKIAERVILINSNYILDNPLYPKISISTLREDKKYWLTRVKFIYQNYDYL